MENLDYRKKTLKIQEEMNGAFAKMSILRRACAYTTNVGKCPLGGSLRCLQVDSLQIRNAPRNCVEPLTELCLESAKMVWKVAEIYAEDIFLTDTPAPALQRFLESVKEK